MFAQRLIVRKIRKKAREKEGREERGVEGVGRRAGDNEGELNGDDDDDDDEEG